MNSFIDAQQAGRSLEPKLMQLPPETRDPFLSLEKRIEATIALLGYTTAPRSLLDWAVAQTGEVDPLSVHNRQELETIFRRWARVRDAHLASLLNQLRHSNPARAREIRESLPENVQESLQRVHVRG